MIHSFILFFFLIFLLLLYFLDFNTLYIIIKQLFYSPSKQECLKNMLNIAKNIPIYSDKIDSINVINIYNCEEVFKKVIPTTKSDFMKDISNTLRDRKLSKEEILSHLKDEYIHTYINKYGKYIISTTSGTSGEMGIFINDWNSWVKTQSILFLNLFYDNLFLLFPSFKIKMTFIVATGGHFTTKKLSVPCFNIFFIDVLVLSIFDENLVEKINIFRPDILHSYPSLLEEIYFNLKINPKIITTGSESLSYGLKSKLEEKFKNTKIITTYGSSECVFMATSCKYGNLHISDQVIIELVDKQGKIIEEENIESSYILITNLINTYQPIIRYKLKDSLEYIRCFCGSHKKAILVHGRIDDFMFFIDVYGVMKKYSSITIECIFANIPEFFTFQFIHYNQNYLDIFLDSDNYDYLKYLVERNLNNFMDKNNLFLYYNIFYKKIERNKSGKYKKIINLVS